MSPGSWATMFYLLVMSSLAQGNSQDAVFSLQVTNPSHQAQNVSFNMDTFMQLYNCLETATTCSVIYIEDFTRTRNNNVMKVTTSLEEKDPRNIPGKLTWSCRRMGAGKLTCTKKHSVLNKPDSGFRPLLCDGAFCKCVYISGNVQIYLDSSKVTDCSDKEVEVKIPKQRTRRQSYRYRIKYRISGGHDLSALSVGEIVGMTFGIIIGVPILILVFCIIYVWCCMKKKDEIKTVDIPVSDLAVGAEQINEAGENVCNVSQVNEGNKDQIEHIDEPHFTADIKDQTEFDQVELNEVKTEQ